MGNSFNISDALLIAALEAKVDIVDTVVDTIRATDVPAIQTNIDANETKIDTIDSVVDAIKIKTDAMPQMVRGSFTIAGMNYGGDTQTNLVNVTGSGKLLQMSIACSTAGLTVELQTTIDGVASALITHTGDTENMIVYPVARIASNTILQFLTILASSYDNNFSNIEFDTSLQIQIRRSAGPGGDIYATAYYIVDNF